MALMLRSFTVPTKDGRTATIREARASDARRYLTAVQSVIEEPVRTLVVTLEELWTEEKFVTQLVPWGHDGVRLVVELDGDIVGALHLYRGPMRANRHVSDFGIFLTEGARGLGLGRAMLEVAEIWAEEMGVTRIELCVFAHNERAQRLYRSMGYQDEGYFKQAIRFPEGDIDEYRMAKLL
jgi:RimJ/RimL family protein N-acetyltransferase